MRTTQPHPQSSEAQVPPASYTLRSLQIIFGVAIVLATLFTAWTPGQFRSTNAANPVTEKTPQVLLVTPDSQITATPRDRLLVGIVAGHWQHDAGAVCSDGLKEVDVNLDIASWVQKLLIEHGFDVEVLAEFDPRLANYQAAALVSIHNDSCDYINNLATGFKVASAFATRYPERAARLTACLRSRYASLTGLPIHNTSVTPDMTSYHAFAEIHENTPAAIIETGFLNLDRQFLTEKPDVAAEGIVAGILCFINNESITLPTPASSPTP